MHVGHGVILGRMTALRKNVTSKAVTSGIGKKAMRAKAPAEVLLSYFCLFFPNASLLSGLICIIPRL
jgi:hypothetical protein